MDPREDIFYQLTYCRKHKAVELSTILYTQKIEMFLIDLQQFTQENTHHLQIITMRNSRKMKLEI
jgi:hypothetical protein